MNINIILRPFLTLPRFTDGRIDYTHSPKAPVLICFIYLKGKILLLKRSDKVGTYKGKWSGVGGYLDEMKEVKDKALEEINEELNINPGTVKDVTLGKSYEYVDKEIGKTWILHPVLVTLNDEPKIQLDWEHTQFAWINPHELSKYDFVPGLDESLKRVLEQ